jgi:hypothetical protein
MTAFAEVQAWMAGALRRRGDLGRDPEAVRTAPAIATGNDRLSPVEQLEIYREQFWLRHTGSLLEDFAGLAGILGQDAWQRLVEDYLEAHPPAAFSLRDLGDRLPAFVERATWLPHPVLCLDMARLEWAYVEVFDAADSSALDPKRLAAIPEAAWPTARLALAPALRLLAVSYPVAALRKRIRLEHEAVPLPAPEAQKLVVYRGADRNLYHEIVGEDAFALLSALREGVPLVAACERAMTEVPERAAAIEASLSDWFRDWAARAWIVGVEHD